MTQTPLTGFTVFKIKGLTIKTPITHIQNQNGCAETHISILYRISNDRGNFITIFMQLSC